MGNTVFVSRYRAAGMLGSGFSRLLLISSIMSTALPVTCRQYGRLGIVNTRTPQLVAHGFVVVVVVVEASK